MRDLRRATLELPGFDRGLVEVGAEPDAVMLAPAEVDAAEAAVRAHLAAQPKPLLSRPYDGYFRQLVGLKKGGARLAWVNAFCDERLGARLATDLVLVKDGGDCFFNALVDLAARRVLWLRVNGEA